VRLRDAGQQHNIPAVLLLQDLTVARLLEFRALGLTTWTGDSSQYGLALTLGGGEVTPLELTTAYATFANGGNRVTPLSILKVERTNGEVLFEYTPPAAERVIDERVAYLISHILDDDAARRPAMGGPTRWSRASPWQPRRRPTTSATTGPSAIRRGWPSASGRATPTTAPWSISAA
jgi:peptidoglycan glycosyltransferase